jgi:hypothetical protein
MRPSGSCERPKAMKKVLETKPSSAAFKLNEVRRSGAIRPLAIRKTKSMTGYRIIGDRINKL